MEKPIDINLFKENPKLFFSQLPEKAKAEINEFLRFVIFKYDIKSQSNKKKEVIENKQENDISNSLLDAFASLRTGLPDNYKFDREEIHER